jgi:hypothetical protein
MQFSNLKTLNADGSCFLSDAESGNYKLQKRMRRAIDDPKSSEYFAAVKRACSRS